MQHRTDANRAYLHIHPASPEIILKCHSGLARAEHDGADRCRPTALALGCRALEKSLFSPVFIRRRPFRAESGWRVYLTVTSLRGELHGKMSCTHLNLATQKCSYYYQQLLSYQRFIALFVPKMIGSIGDTQRGEKGREKLIERDTEGLLSSIRARIAVMNEQRSQAPDGSENSHWHLSQGSVIRGISLLWKRLVIQVSFFFISPLSLRCSLTKEWCVKIQVSLTLFGHRRSPELGQGFLMLRLSSPHVLVLQNIYST